MGKVLRLTAQIAFAAVLLRKVPENRSALQAKVDFLGSFDVPTLWPL
jgi:hypothetical protein